jgi:6-phosphogluconolactonase
MKIITFAFLYFIGIFVQASGNLFDSGKNEGESSTLNVYFGTGGKETKGIYHSNFDAVEGKLSKPSLAAEISSPGFIALHPDGDKLYAVGILDNQSVVAGYTINGSGDLSLFTRSNIQEGGAAHISVHPSGKFLLTAQYGAGTVELFPMEDDGSLLNSQITRHEGGSNVVPGRQKSPHPHWCGFSPDGRFAFVPDLGMDQIVIYKVDMEKPEIKYHGYAESIPGGGPRHMRFSIDGKFIYLLNELTLSVTTFSYDFEAGTTIRLSTTPSISEEVKKKEEFNSAAEILVHPNGRFVYSSNRGNDSITAYEADTENGRLTVIEVEAIRGSWPRNINIDPSGRWILSAGAHSNTISVHSIDQFTGELTFVKNSIVNVPGPICILFAE